MLLYLFLCGCLFFGEKHEHLTTSGRSCQVVLHIDRPIIFKTVIISTYETTSLNVCSGFIGRLNVHRLVGIFKI